MSEKRRGKTCHCSKIKVCKRGKRGKERMKVKKNNKMEEIESKKTIRCAIQNIENKK